MSLIMFELNVLWNECPIDKTFELFESGLGIKMYKMDLCLMSYLMYHTKSDIKGFVCIFVISW